MADSGDRWRGSRSRSGAGGRGWGRGTESGRGQNRQRGGNFGARGSTTGRGERRNTRGEGGNLHRGRTRLCRFIEHGKHCLYGDNCSFSHDTANTSSSSSTGGLADTPEQCRDREDYHGWKRLIKRPPMPNDLHTIGMIWQGALKILDEGDRNWKQMVPRDLDSEENHGRDHMDSLLSMSSNDHGQTTFVTLAQPFLSVFTHSAMLDCLSVDTFVGNLYSFISGTNGSRVIPFLTRLCTNLANAYGNAEISKDFVETALAATLILLREILKREQRAAFHEGLPDLINFVENTADTTGIGKADRVHHIILNQSREIRAIIARVNGLLPSVPAPTVDGVSTTILKYTYPRQVIVPGGKHDNDHGDITKIKILPTEDEIRSDEPEFLPTTDLDQPHFLNDPVARHLDTQFRLLHHDIFGELKVALAGLIHSITDDPKLLESWKLNLGDMRAYAYPNAYLAHVSNENRDFEAHVSFSQIQALLKKTASQRCEWWDNSSRLEEGALLCFVSSIGNRTSLLFLTVSKKCTNAKKDRSLTSDDWKSTIVTKLATRSQSDLETMIKFSCQGTRGALIDFPGILLATFVPILENLQTMYRSGRLPFQQWILPNRQTHKSAKATNIPPPLYARTHRFSFSLDSILEPAGLGSGLSYSPEDGYEANSAGVLSEIEERTSLDRAQCEALIAALTREFALLQGPPGTGKTYLGVKLMSVILACKAKADLGPVVVVCYTNHALDQFLEHLIEIGIDKIIRIGGQSKSSLLEGKNLRVVAQGEAKTKSEGYLLAQSYRRLDEDQQQINSLLGLLHATKKKPEWVNLKHHIERRHPRIFTQFSRFDEDGFETVGKEPFQKVLAATSLSFTSKPGKTSIASRRLNAIDWWNLGHEIREQQENIHGEINRRVLQTADVIGVTTTGLARGISVLQRVHSKIIICEEAGEVMEPHMISAMLPYVEHFIQIGDHQQLRPQINNHGLSIESKRGNPYQLDRSQFERLSMGETGRPAFPVAQLNVQRRMRPEVSTLIQSTLYPRLIDHGTTKTFPDVVGMRENVFWLDHTNMEEQPSADRHQKSRSNDWEVDMIHALVRHIVRQGVYSSSQIAVLTPYTGQLQKLRAKMRSDFEVVLSERDEEKLTQDGFDHYEDVSAAEESQTIENRSTPLEKKKLSEML
ncbi:P-loop containing nucleoside triphosphate hydrolase [Glarea lozoyensis ATCC 20868]|uniref:p-loop containing nucleoside triphosphate hydrolase n=1 Tax=Glarea lozoyensis (strain ATCC 20868 / MF5171) TaxID=1116229 RepID=S3D0V6_GLAL2|nr:P-loop containing nucleoside triphosphate hydrolase [Glarea lozoyensis ATCC 20868]EPE32162.1 P-loop containing nucleoside triphosphate hydrolase [Glarea lozoyensis ATCC 20868]